jgi:hypothetical protein
MQDPIAQTIADFIGFRIKVRIGKFDYVGEILSADDDVVVMTSGIENPMNVTLRTDQIDSVMIFENLYPVAERQSA